MKTANTSTGLVRGRLTRILVAGVLFAGSLLAQPVAAENPLKGWQFYVDPHSAAREQARAWHDSRPVAARHMRTIARQPQGIWLGEWNQEPKREVAAWADAAAAEGTVPIFVLYNIPRRDCGSHSAGGAADSAAYRTFVDRVAAGLGDRPAVVIVEPDALGVTDCLTKKQKARRFRLLAYAVAAFKDRTQAAVYIDAGNPNWTLAPLMAKRLHKSGVAAADGFALNVSKFYRTSRNHRYGEELSKLTGGKHFVIDTSRNGQGPTVDFAWCNPLGRGLGHRPTTAAAHPRVDALLWIKPPGESDGECNGGPAAGQWWADYAIGLARRAQF